MFRATICFLFALALGGCASAPRMPDAVAALFADERFERPAQPIRPESIFAPSDAMRSYLATEIAFLADRKGRQQALFEALYDWARLKLEYDSETTRTAAEAFDARAGNCLSLVIMTASLAHELGLEVEYQRIVSDDAWSRSGGLYFAASHVNLTLSRKAADRWARADERVSLTIDFVPPRPNERPRARSLAEPTVLAMFMNNRAAEALARGDADEAYWWARAAIAQDPTFLTAFNTLGVIYRHRGHLAHAERAFRHVLELEPFNPHTMANLALVYADQGRHAESRLLEARLERIEPEPPFHFFDRARQAMERGDYAAAKALFAREIERDPYYHEFHFGFAAASLALGEVEAARKHLAIAQDNSPTRGKRELYAAKLARLRGR